MPKLTDYIDFKIVWKGHPPVQQEHYGILKDWTEVKISFSELIEIRDMLNIREEVIQIEHEKGLKSQPPEPK